MQTIEMRRRRSSYEGKQQKKSFEGTSGISALVDSSNITVNLIKYIVIPKEASLISRIWNTFILFPHPSNQKPQHQLLSYF